MRYTRYIAINSRNRKIIIKNYFKFKKMWYNETG